jgi:hypothetical protein
MVSADECGQASPISALRARVNVLNRRPARICPQALYEPNLLARRQKNVFGAHINSEKRAVPRKRAADAIFGSSRGQRECLRKPLLQRSLLSEHSRSGSFMGTHVRCLPIATGVGMWLKYHAPGEQDRVGGPFSRARENFSWEVLYRERNDGAFSAAFASE